MTLRIIVMILLLVFPLRVEHKHFPYDMKQAQCLAVALFHEGRGEGITGRLAVAGVALNRAYLDSAGHSIDVCKVISQPGQFSWYRKHPHMLTIDELGDILYEAHTILQQYEEGLFIDITGGATHFATKNTKNAWTRRYRRTLTSGNHVFYRER